MSRCALQSRRSLLNLGPPGQGRCGLADGSTMDLHRIVRASCISSREANSNRDASSHSPLEHHPVPPAQALEGEGQTAELIHSVRVGAGEVEDEIGAVAPEQV